MEIFGTTKKARGRQINKVEGQVAKSFAYLAANELILLVEDCGRGKNDTLPGFRPGITFKVGLDSQVSCFFLAFLALEKVELKMQKLSSE